MQPQFRSSAHEIGDLLVGTPTGQQIPLKQLADIRQGNGASLIYRENNSRYIGVQYSIEGRDLERAVADGQAAVRKAVTCPRGIAWSGRRVQRVPGRQGPAHGDRPITVLLIFLILFALYATLSFLSSSCSAWY